MKYDIHNPTQSMRIIRDGFVTTRIEILPGKTLNSVELSDSVAARLMAIKDDLKLTPVPGSEKEVETVAAGELKINDDLVTVVKAPVVPAGKKTLSVPDAKV